MSHEQVAEKSIKINGYEIRRDRFYSREHEWALIEENGNVRVGITDYAQKSLHDIVYVEMPSVGSKVNQMNPIGTVESIKSVSEIYSPVSGEVINVNNRLSDSPELLNTSPYDDGWIVVIKPSALDDEIKNLMKPEEYADYIRKLIREKK
ncbi:MAG: glycine cleavage system protein GcvH [Candidatus Bathyarchaeia archaeon]